MEENMNTMMPTYNRIPIRFVRGSGAWLYADNEDKYLDALAGIAVCGLGHAHPRITKAITDQASTLIHTSNLYEIPLQEELANRLCELTNMDNVFFANSGAEANEAAIKIARRHGDNRGIENPQIIVMEGSFHGRTMATLTATGNRKVHAGFEPLLSGFVRAPYNDIQAIEKIASNKASSIVAVFVEPVLGEGGVVIPKDNYLQELQRICDENDWLLMLDEVQTGNGRTGKYLACEHSGVVPHVVTTAKGLGNGLPIGACMARGIASEILIAGTHGSTFGGNPLVCAGALAVLDELTTGGVIERAEYLGQRIKTGLEKALDGSNHVKEIRGAGMMIAVETTEPCPELIQRALERKLLLNVTADSVLRLLPPLNLSDEEADQIVEIVSGLVESLGDE